ncbi:MAG: ribosomal protein S18-alanine N-acetyltransferase [Clostridia bacterium]|nr:ribosomal protein S18-alanine N-acetyltransferase [Clostridia bacterium]
MNYSVVEMNESHVASIAQLEKECFSSPWSENAIREELANPNSHFLVAQGNEVFGYIGVQEICGEAYITNVAVFAEHRRIGAGRALLKSAADGARARGCEFITLEVRKSNSAAISLYISEGFEEAGIRKNFYTAPVEDAVLYTKRFE